MSSLLNLEAIQNARVKNEPYPYFVVERSVDESAVMDVIADFPHIEHGGSYDLTDVTSGPKFQALLDSIDSPEFRHLLCDKFDVQVMDLPMMITLRGVSRQKDGRIHSDSKTKVVTILIYLNESWDASTGKLRILRSKDNMEDYVEEVAPGPGALIAFKVTDDCWHGYEPFVGRRQSIQINFLTGGAANTKHRFFHRLSAKIKKMRKSEQM